MRDPGENFEPRTRIPLGPAFDCDCSYDCDCQRDTSVVDTFWSPRTESEIKVRARKGESAKQAIERVKSAHFDSESHTKPCY